jgi:serine/threonine protein kinase
LLNSDGYVKLADFGFSRPVNFNPEEICTIGVGTHGYRSPESDDGDYSKGDEYSIGIVLFKLLTGRLPFGDPVKNMRSFLKN